MNNLLIGLLFFAALFGIVFLIVSFPSVMFPAFAVFVILSMAYVMGRVIILEFWNRK